MVDKMGSNPSKMAHVQTIKVESARADKGDDNMTTHTDDKDRLDEPLVNMNKDDKERLAEPLAYRDSDGQLQIYKKEEAPTVWVPNGVGSKPLDVQSVKQSYIDDKRNGDVTHKRLSSAKTSKSEGHIPRSVKSRPDSSDTRPVVREGFITPEDSNHGDEQPGTSSPRTQAIPDTKPKTLSTEYTLFRDGTFIQGTVKTTDTGLPEFKPPSINRRDLIPEEDMFEDIDKHVLKTPVVLKEDMSKLVSYLTEPACTPLDEVRALYMWITHNINYDTSGFFGRSKLMATDPESVLKTRTTVCEGYTKLLDVFCKIVAIPAKIIKGYVKGFGYQPGDDVKSDAHNAHMWNAVYIENNWFFIDVTLGAGYVKSKEKTYVAKFNPLYFICDPSIFICDHFPFVKGDKCNNANQLLAEPITLEEFNMMLNMEKCGKEWGIEAISHTSAVIKDIKYEVDIQLQQTYMLMSDYLAFLYHDGQKLDQYAYTHKTDPRTVNIHVILPRKGEHVLHIYGRRKQDPPDSNLEPIIRYILKCKLAYDNPTPFPNHHTLYGLVDDPDKYGLADVGNVVNTAESGEAILKLRPIENTENDFTDLVPRLFYGDHTSELKTQTFIEYSEDFKELFIRVRVPFKGYFKLVLCGKPSDGAQLKPFMTFLIENKKAVNEEEYPIAHTHSLIYKCRLQEPLRRKLASGQNYLVLVNVKSQLLAKVKAHETELKKSDDVTYEGLVTAPKQESTDFVIYGADKADGSYHPLYTCKMISGNVLSVPSAITLPE